MNKRTFTIFIIAILCSSIITAQDRFFTFVDGWVNNYCFENQNQYTYLGLDVVGLSWQHQYLYNHLNEAGNVVGNSTYNIESTSTTTTRLSAYMAEWLNENELLICGTLEYEGADNSYGTLVKYNVTSDDFEVITTYNQFPYNQFYCLDIAAQNNIVVAGHYTDGTIQPGLQIAELDLSGNSSLLYDTQCGSSCANLPQQIIKNASSDIFILAEEFDVDFPTFYERLSTVLIKINELGEEQWKIYPGDFENYWIDPGGIIEQDDGFLVFFANPRYYDTDGQWHANLESSIYIEKYDNQGELLYSESVDNDVLDQFSGQENSVFHEINKVEELDDNHYLITGRMGYRAFLLKVDENYNVVWYRLFTPHTSVENPTAQRTHLYDTNSTSDGGFVMAGQYNSDPGIQYPDGIQTAIALKVDEYGCLEPGCHLIDGLETIKLGLQNSMHVFPNPIEDELTIQWSEEALITFNSIEDSHILILDAFGREVYQKSLVINNTSAQSTIQLNGLPSGLYTLHWLSGNDWLDSIKITKE